MDEFYKSAPDGLIGNEDCGQMSAWYVMSASGFYSVAPGRSMYEMGTPLFPEVKYNLENGKVFTVRAPNVSAANKYIRSASFGGKRLISPHIAHSWMMTGGTLELEMSAVPEKQAFTRSPVSLVADDYAPVPVIQATELIFRSSTTVSMSAMPPRRQSKVTIHYTTDGSEPTESSPPA